MRTTLGWNQLMQQKNTTLKVLNVGVFCVYSRYVTEGFAGFYFVMTISAEKSNFKAPYYAKITVCSQSTAILASTVLYLFASLFRKRELKEISPL